MSTKDKLKKLAEGQAPSKWTEIEEYKPENWPWLDKSMDIALKILDILDQKNMSQNDLATVAEVSRQQISKILKGQENLTLKTIAKLEQVLGTTLVIVPEEDSSIMASQVLQSRIPVYAARKSNVSAKAGNIVSAKTLPSQQIPYGQKITTIRKNNFELPS